MMKAMGMIKCEDALARLWEFLDGELPPDEDAAVRKHLEFCNRCYPQYDFQRAYFAYTRHVREEDRAPVELRRRLFQTLLEREATEGEAR